MYLDKYHFPAKSKWEELCTITNPQHVADYNTMAFADDSSSAHYSETLQTMKEQDKKAGNNINSDSTDIDNKPSKLKKIEVVHHGGQIPCHYT